MDAVHRAVAAVKKRHTTKVSKALDALIQELEAPHTETAGLKKAVQDADVLAKIQKEHKLLHSAVSKLGKAVDKALDDDSELFCRNQLVHQGEVRGTHAAIVDHLYRGGHFGAADEVARTAAVTVPPAEKLSLEAMYSLASLILQGKLDEPLQWVDAHRAALTAIASPVEFELHALQFTALLHSTGAGAAAGAAAASAQPRVSLALAYSRHVFPRFVADHGAAVKRLMGAVLYAGSLPSSPYADLVSTARVKDVHARFLHDGCRVLGVATHSALELTLDAGRVAMPTLMKMTGMMRRRGGVGVGRDDNLFADTDLPVEVPLPPQLQFHSVFACPVSRENTRPGNPPMLLRCGHVISKESLDGLAAHHHRFKCPTCPVVQAPRDALELKML